MLFLFDVEVIDFGMFFVWEFFVRVAECDFVLSDFVLSDGEGLGVCLVMIVSFEEFDDWVVRFFEVEWYFCRGHCVFDKGDVVWVIGVFEWVVVFCGDEG